MSKEEKIILGLALVAIMAVVIFQRKPIASVLTGEAPNDPVADIGQSLTPRNDSVVKGPAYMTYNAPWFFAPPIGNFLPSATAGIGAQTVNQPTDFAGFDPGCGCK